MANFKIENITSSMLDLSVIKDVHGTPVSLRPQGNAGATREISFEASKHEAVERVVASQWVRLIRMGVALDTSSDATPILAQPSRVADPVPEEIPTPESTIVETSTEIVPTETSAESTPIEEKPEPVPAPEEPVPAPEERQEPMSAPEAKPPVEVISSNRNQSRRNR